MNRAIESANVEICTDIPFSQLQYRWLALICVLLCGACATVNGRKAPSQILSVRFVAESTCHSYHTMQLFSDGAVRYEAHHRVLFADDKATEKVLAKSHYKMNRGDLQRMLDIAGKFNLKPIQGLPADIDEDPFQPRFLSGSGTELMSQLRELFDETLHVGWYQLPVDTMPCAVQKYRPIDGIQLNTDAVKLFDKAR